MGSTFSVDVLDSAGTVLGRGPLDSVLTATLIEELDAAGAVQITVPATDTRVISLLQVGRRLRVRTLDGIYREGFIERKATSAGQVPTISAGGLDLLDELNRYSNGLARIYDNEDVASVVIPDLLSGLGTTWTADVAAGLGNVTARFDGGSRLYAIQMIRERLGVHFRQSTTPRTLELKTFGTDSGIRLDNITQWRVGLESNTALGIVDSLEIVADTTATVNRVIPLGAGDGQGQLDLRYCSAARAANVLVRRGPRRGATVGGGPVGSMTLTVVSSAGFVAGDPVFVGDAGDLSASHEFNQVVATPTGTSITLAGPLQASYTDLDVLAWPELYIQAGSPTDVRERVMVWKDIAPISNSEVDLQAASNALYDVANAYLTWYSVPQTVYRVNLVSLPTSVHVGDKVRLVYKGAVTRNGSVYSYLDVDELVWVLKIQRAYNANGSVSVAVDVSDVDRRVVGDDEIVASALQTGEVFKSYTQQYPAVFRDTDREPMDGTHDATVIIDITNDILYLGKCRLRVRTFPFRAFATGMAAGGGTVQTTSAGGGGTQTSSAGGGTTATSRRGGGATVTSGGSAHRHVLAVLSPGSLASPTGYVGDIPASTSGTGDLDIIAQAELALDSVASYARIGTYNDSPAHTHSVTISAHTHNVTLADHTHDVTFPDHTHDVTLGDHTHDLDYGIHEDNQHPDTISLAINGNDVTTELGGPWAVGGAALTDLELDITQFLRNASGGLRQAHELTWSCTGGQGMIETVVKMLLTAQNIVVS